MKEEKEVVSKTPGLEKQSRHLEELVGYARNVLKQGCDRRCQP